MGCEICLPVGHLFEDETFIRDHVAGELVKLKYEVN